MTQSAGHENLGTAIEESTPLNKLAVADPAWARMPVDSLNMTLA